MLSLWLILLTLGLVQGLTEFLPVSSSGHLAIIEQFDFIRQPLLEMGEGSVLFLNVAFHIATLMAVIVFMRRDILNLIKGIFSAIATRTFNTPEVKTTAYVLAACVPAGIAGIVFKDWVESLFSSPLAVFFLLILNGIILVLSKKIPLNDRKLEETGTFRSLLVGLFQAIAIVPGISRSGMTIVGGMINGLNPVNSARFSFLIAIPVIAGAGLIEGLHAMKGGLSADLWIPLTVALVFTFFIALAALRILLAIISTIRLHLFGYYTIAAGITGVIATLLLK